MDVEQLLRENEKKDLLKFVTAGSVDDGKSTLIGRLLYESAAIYEDQLDSIKDYSRRRGAAAEDIDLSLVTDGLRSEREQGITIDVAYRYFSTPRRKFIIADTPGHEQYTRNTATGASTSELMLLLVDATQGVRTQSRRHSFIASLLGIRHLVIAVNKMDLVDYSRDVFDEIHEELSAFMVKLDISDTNFIPVSALKGDNVITRSSNMDWYNGSTLLNYLETVEVASDRNLIDLRLPIQYVCRPDRTFRGYMGSVASGVIRSGDELMVLPSGVSSRVKEIYTQDGVVDEAFPPLPVTVTLEDDIDLGRGDMITHVHNITDVDNTLEAMIVWMSEEPMDVTGNYYFKHLHNLVGGDIVSLRYRINVNTLHREDADALALNQIGRAVIILNRPIPYDPYTRNKATGSFIIIDRITNNTVGAGLILDRAPGELVGTPDRLEERPPDEIKTVSSAVSPETRTERYGQQAATIWLTGLTGSGKTTLARALEKRLFDDGYLCAVFDGENLRMGLNRDLGFAANDRSENVRRAAEVARIFNESGMISICALLSPSAEDRARARKIVGANFFEVFLSAPDEVRRDRNQVLYEKADKGKIRRFPGVTAPYDPPDHSELVLETDTATVDECVDSIIAMLRNRDILEG